MDARIALERALESTGSLIGQIAPDQLDRPTPCAEWDVRALVNHLIGDLWYLEGKLTGQERPDAAPPGGLPIRDLVGDDASLELKRATEATLDAATPAALKSEAITAGAITSDLVTHGWDLAQATGQAPSADEELAAYCLAFVRKGVPAEGREKSPAFGPVVEVPTDASQLSQLAGYLGHHVS